VKDALLVPQQAVTELQNMYTVTVVGEGNKVATRQVKVGPKAGTSWILESGVKSGEMVVVAGAEKLHDGMVVKPIAGGEK
jgi:membrane fusion protein (multidrug efflux system)